MDAIPVELLGIGSGWTLAGVCFWLVFSGRLVAAPIHDEIVTRLESEVALRREENKELRESLAVSLEGNRTAGAALAGFDTSVAAAVAALTKPSSSKTVGPLPDGDASADSGEDNQT